MMLEYPNELPHYLTSINFFNTSMLQRPEVLMAMWHQRCPKQLTELQLRAVTVALVLTIISVVVDITSAAAVVDRQQLVDQSLSGSAPGRPRREVDKRAPRLASWGKREQGGVPETESQVQVAPELGQGAPEIPDTGYVESAADRDKRPARLASWGKKRVDGGTGLDRFSADKSTRSKWSSGSMSVWGKRSASGVDILDDEYYNDDREKRNSKWSGSNFAVWGKREEDEKRGWANKNNMAVWG